MNIGNYIAIYAALVATIVLFWNIIHSRKYLKLVYHPTGEDVDFCVDIHVTNKTSKPIELIAMTLGKYRRDYRIYSDDICQVFCECRTFHRQVKGVIGKIRIPLEENERAVFWMNVKALRKEYPVERYCFRYICFFDSFGGIHINKLPRKIITILNVNFKH